MLTQSTRKCTNVSYHMLSNVRKGWKPVITLKCDQEETDRNLTLYDYLNELSVFS